MKAEIETPDDQRSKEDLHTAQCDDTALVISPLWGTGPTRQFGGLLLCRADVQCTMYVLGAGTCRRKMSGKVGRSGMCGALVLCGSRCVRVIVVPSPLLEHKPTPKHEISAPHLRQNRQGGVGIQACVPAVAV